MRQSSGNEVSAYELCGWRAFMLPRYGFFRRKNTLKHLVERATIVLGFTNLIAVITVSLCKSIRKMFD